MPSSTVRTFTDPVAYFTGIRNLQIVGLVRQRGAFRATLTRIDLPRVLMCRFDENLPRIMKVTPSGRRTGILFATNPDQRPVLMNGVEISQGQIGSGCIWNGTFDLRPRVNGEQCL